MFNLLIILAIIFAVLLILIVLIQNPKGGGVAANFSAANQIAGVKKTNDFVEKATWTLAIGLIVLSLGSRMVYTTDVDTENAFLERIEETATPAAPSTPQIQQQAPPEGAQIEAVEAKPEESDAGSLGD
ncbi:MAG: preprotein translocase subunit SecG [Bacteroidia bacterium]|nr:preprotein translocase subunit SecG [Bacteroidia bacterium]